MKAVTMLPLRAVALVQFLSRSRGVCGGKGCLQVLQFVRQDRYIADPYTYSSCLSVMLYSCTISYRLILITQITEVADSTNTDPTSTYLL